MTSYTNTGVIHSQLGASDGTNCRELKNRQRWSFPSNTETPRNVGNLTKEQCQDVTLRSGKPLIELWRPEEKEPSDSNTRWFRWPNNLSTYNQTTFKLYIRTPHNATKTKWCAKSIIRKICINKRLSWDTNAPLSSKVKEEKEWWGAIPTLSRCA